MQILAHLKSLKMLKALKVKFLARKVHTLGEVLSGDVTFGVEEPPSLEIFQDFTRQIIHHLHELKSLVVSYTSGDHSALWHFQDTALRLDDCTVAPNSSAIHISSQDMTCNAEQKKVGIWQGDLQVATQPLEREGRVYKCFDELYVSAAYLRTKPIFHPLSC